MFATGSVAVKVPTRRLQGSSSEGVPDPDDPCLELVSEDNPDAFLSCMEEHYGTGSEGSDKSRDGEGSTGGAGEPDPDDPCLELADQNDPIEFLSCMEATYGI